MPVITGRVRITGGRLTGVLTRGLPGAAASLPLQTGFVQPEIHGGQRRAISWRNYTIGNTCTLM